MDSRNLIDAPLTLAELERAAQDIYTVVQPTPQINWPLLDERCACEVWVKHENHLPTGAFKVRGGLWYMRHLAQTPGVAGVVAATRGNHGQSVAFAASRHGLKALIVVPHGNNPDQNRAMQAFGAELIEHGRDFDDALGFATTIAEEQALHAMPSFHSLLVQGVGTYSLEFLQHMPDLDAVYVPIGLGSGIAGMIAARNALGLDTEIVGVVAERADAYARSFSAGHVEETASADTIADGLAVRVPHPVALAYIMTGVDHIVRVGEAEILAAIAEIFSATHNVAEGAGASALAALVQERESMVGKKVGIVLSGGNSDRKLFLHALGAG